MELPMALSIENWSKATDSERMNYVVELEKLLGIDFKISELTRAAWPDAIKIAIFIHKPSQTKWCLIPGGELMMGLSEDEERAAKRLINPPPLSPEEMRPEHRESVGPFLMMQYPISESFAYSNIHLQHNDLRPKFEGSGNYVPLYLTKEEISGLMKATGFELPTEAQWEFACRARSQTLFFFGDDLPEDEGLESLVSTRMLRSNPFSLYGLFFGEWCADDFTSYYGGPIVNKGISVIRGGGSAFWPWQESGEWAFCVSAMRMPSSDLMNGFCGARLVRNIFRT